MRRGLLKKTPFPVIVERDGDGWYVVSNPAFEGCHSQGKTLEEALENIKEATVLCAKEKRAEHPHLEVSLHVVRV